MPPRPDNAARTHRPRGPSGVARGCEALLYPEKRRVFRMILAHYLLRVDGKRDADYRGLGRGACNVRYWPCPATRVNRCPVAGLERTNSWLHQSPWSRPWADVLSPAIRAAR